MHAFFRPAAGQATSGCCDDHLLGCGLTWTYSSPGYGRLGVPIRPTKDSCLCWPYWELSPLLPGRTYLLGSSAGGGAQGFSIQVYIGFNRGVSGLTKSTEPPCSRVAPKPMGYALHRIVVSEGVPDRHGQNFLWSRTDETKVCTPHLHIYIHIYTHIDAYVYVVYMAS